LPRPTNNSSEWNISAAKKITYRSQAIENNTYAMNSRYKTAAIHCETLISCDERGLALLAERL
jgi:hypothetical protein